MSRSHLKARRIDYSRYLLAMLITLSYLPYYFTPYVFLRILLLRFHFAPLSHKLLRFRNHLDGASHVQTPLNKLRNALGFRRFAHLCRKPIYGKTSVVREKKSRETRRFLRFAQRNTRREIASRRVVQFCVIVSSRARETFRSTCRSTYRREKYGQRLLDYDIERPKRSTFTSTRDAGLASRRVAFLPRTRASNSPHRDRPFRSEARRWRFSKFFLPTASLDRHPSAIDGVEQS